MALMDKVVTFLKQRPEQKFIARDIAAEIRKIYSNEFDEKLKRSTATAIPINDEKSLVQQIAAEIGAHIPKLQKKNKNIKTTEGRPRKYYFTESTDSSEIENAESAESDKASPALTVNNSPIKENNLYPKLSSFLKSDLEIYSMRIDESRSSNSQGNRGNRWLYPDLVGIENLSSDWDREIKDCVELYKDKKTKLWSFEVKILINRSNVREAFFQAVSNSSWANFGYLVASEIEGVDTVKEFRMLAGLHGIGFIRLDIENPAESQIMIPATERSEIDWNTANRLVKENKDFKKYIKLIRQFYQTGEMREADWD